MPRIEIAGQETGFACDGDDTIMRAAVRAGLGFPYECNVGSCGNCRFDLVEGAVEHVRADAPAYTERHRQRNQWLGCQARPLGDCTIKLRLNPRYESRHPPQRSLAKLVAVMPVSHDIREFRFELATGIPFLPGQYALLSIPGIDGKRPYSMCNVDPTGRQWHFQIRRVLGGLATAALFDMLPVGVEIEVDGPYGMAYLREDAPRDLICLAGGSGLSPMVAIARGAALSEHLTGRKIHFLYGGRTPRDICGEPILSELPGWGERIFYYSSVSSAEGNEETVWSGRTGFLHDVAADLFGKRMAEHEIYFAGPPAMAEAVQRTLHALEVPADQVHFDQFF